MTLPAHDPSVRAPRRGRAHIVFHRNIRHALFMAIRDGGFSTADELGAKIGVSKRTIYRYVQVLRAAGHPIKGEAGVGYWFDNAARRAAA